MELVNDQCTTTFRGTFCTQKPGAAFIDLPVGTDLMVIPNAIQTNYQNCNAFNGAICFSGFRLLMGFSGPVTAFGCR